MLQVGNTKSKSRFCLFFLQQCLPFPLLLQACVPNQLNGCVPKDPGLSIQVFTSFLEYRNVGRLLNKILFVNSKQHKRFFSYVSLSFTVFHLQQLMKRPSLWLLFLKPPIQTLSTYYVGFFLLKKKKFTGPCIGMWMSFLSFLSIWVFFF